MVSLRIGLVLISSVLISGAFASEHLPSVNMGYHDGFYVRTDDNRFRLKVGTRLDAAYTYGFISPDTDFSSFDLLHAKFYMGGNAFGPTVQYYLQVAAANHTRPPASLQTVESTTGTFRLEDFYVRLNWKQLHLQFGQYKVPFGRQWMTYSGNFQFVDRSFVTKTFALGRDRGVVLAANPGKTILSFGLFNGGGNPTTGTGFQPSRLSTNAQNVSNDTAGGGRGHLYLARLVSIPLGATGYSEGDVENREEQRLELGFGFVFDHSRDIDLTGDRIVDDIDADIMSFNSDLTWKYQGRSFQSEFFFQNVNGISSGKQQSMGFYVQPGYFVVPSRVEIALRFGWVDPDLNMSQDRVLEGACAINYYHSSDHRYKTQLQYTWLGYESSVGNRNDNSFIDVLFQLTL